MGDAPEKQLLNEDQAVELIALFISSARLLISEPAAYGPLRLLTATERLSAMIIDDVSPPTQKLLQLCIDRIPHTYTLANEIPQYAAAMDVLCEALGQCLAERAKLEGGNS